MRGFSARKAYVFLARGISMGRDCSLVHPQSTLLRKTEIVSVVVNTANFSTKNKFLILDLVVKRRLVCH